VPNAKAEVGDRDDGNNGTALQATKRERQSPEFQENES
jgi:hypothetical protein